MDTVTNDDLVAEIAQYEARIKEFKASLGKILSKEMKARVNREIHMLEKRQKEAQNKLEERRVR
jgi:hypothetical protein